MSRPARRAHELRRFGNKELLDRLPLFRFEPRREHNIPLGVVEVRESPQDVVKVRFSNPESRDIRFTARAERQSSSLQRFVQIPEVPA